MATYTENLMTRRATVAARLAALTDGTGIGDKPNTQGGQGSSIDHVGYRQSLLEELAQIDELLASAGQSAQAADVIANGPWELRS